MEFDASALPADWQFKPVREVTVRTSQRDPRKQRDKIFRYVDVSSVDNTLYKVRNVTELKGSEAPSRARKEIHANDVLFATVRPTLKRAALIPQELDGEIASTGYCVLRADPERVTPNFLYECLLTDWFIDAIGKLERGANYPAVRDSDVFNIRIPLPPLIEQRKITAVLEVVQRAIEQQERLIALATELKKALLHKLFTEGLCGEPQRQTEIGPVPESWEIRRLGDHCVSSAFGPRFSSDLYTADGNVVTLRTTDLDDDGNIDYRDAPKARLEIKKFESHFLKVDDVVVSRSGTCGIAAVFEGHGMPVLPGAFLIRVRLAAGLRPQFLRYYINSCVGRPRMMNLAQGAIQKNISGTALKAFELPVPSIAEQAEIEAQVKAVDQKLRLHTQKREVLTDLFRTLLHQLMTAQVRVHDVDLTKDGIRLVAAGIP
jgi:type I restriction enzyme S subunit